MPPIIPFPLTRGPDGIKRFSNAKIQSAIDSALSEASPDDKLVIVAHHVYNDDGTRVENITKLSALYRLSKGFSVVAGSYKDWAKGDLGVEGKIIWKPF